MESNFTPKLRRHKGRNQGAVTINGKHVYLGRWPASAKNPPAAIKHAYDQVIAEWLVPT